MYSLLHIALKDISRSMRSLFGVGMMIGTPLLLTGLIYLAFSGLINSADAPTDMAPVSVIVVNQDDPVDGNALGQMMVDFLHDEAMPDWLMPSEMDDEAAAREAVQNQQAGVAVIIPPDFSANLLHGGQAVLTIVQDPTLTIGPDVVRNLLAQFLDGVSSARMAVNVLQQRASANGVELQPEDFGTAAGQYSQWFIGFQQALNHGEKAPFTVHAPAGDESNTTATRSPMAVILGLIMAGQMIFFSFYTGAYMTTSLLREQEEGTLARLFSTPVPRTAILGGTFVAVFATCLIQALVLIGLSRLLFGIQWGNPGSMAIALVGQVAVAGGLGVFLISLVKNSQQSGSVLGGGLTVLGMLGGLFTVAVPNMPQSFQLMGKFTPQGWALEAWKRTVSGGTPEEVLIPVLIMLAMGAAFFILGARIFRRRFA